MCLLFMLQNTAADYFFLLTYMIALFEGHFLVKSHGYYNPLISVEKSYNNNFSFVETKLKDLNLDIELIFRMYLTKSKL